MTGDCKYDYQQAFDEAIEQGMDTTGAEQHAADILGDYYTDVCDDDEYPCCIECD